MFDLNELSEISKNIKADIKKNAEDSVYKLWFESMEVLKLSEFVIVISVPDSLKKINIERHQNLILQSIKHLYGKDVSVIVYSTQDGDISKEQIDADERALINEKKAAAEIMTETPIYTTNAENIADAAEINRNVTSEYTFENFVVGNSNRFAYEACTVIAQYPAKRYNPFFIYGPPGLGKTHLLYAIANEYKKRFNAHVLYTTGEEFTNHLINSLAEKQPNLKQQYLQMFRKKYRDCDMLLIDDIQFLENKDTTQEEFFHTFNALYTADKQIIMTSDRPPRNIQTLEVRLTSRFESGLIADIQPPDLELRSAILKRKSETMGISVPNEVLLYLAENISSNIRQIEGVIKKLNAYSILNKTGITLELAQTCLADILSGTEPVNVTVEKIISLVAQRFSVSQEELKSRKRTKEIAFARNIAIYIIREVTDLSTPHIGRIFDRDHTTVLSATNSIEEKTKTNASLKLQLEEIASIAKGATKT